MIIHESHEFVACEAAVLIRVCECRTEHLFARPRPSLAGRLVGNRIVKQPVHPRCCHHGLEAAAGWAAGGCCGIDGPRGGGGRFRGFRGGGHPTHSDDTGRGGGGKHGLCSPHAVFPLCRSSSRRRRLCLCLPLERTTLKGGRLCHFLCPPGARPVPLPTLFAVCRLLLVLLRHARRVPNL